MNKIISKKMVTNIDAAKRRHRRGCDHVRFDWEKVSYDATKFKAIRCHKEADRVFLFRVLAASQAIIPPGAVWDALEAVKRIHPKIPIGYFRVVLKDNCTKAGIDLDKALRGVRVSADLPRFRPSKPRTTPLPDDALKLCADELQKLIP